MLKILAPLVLALAACAPSTADLAASSPSSATDTSSPASSSPTAAGDLTMTETDDSSGDDAQAATELATFGAGCFWCVEAVFEQLDGVLDVQSGYMGGESSKPSYQEVCSGASGHAEVVHLTFEPSVISFEELVSWFWRLHDPTTLNRQGADVGTQYRSAIFTHSDAQAATARASMKAAQPAFDNTIVTEVTPASDFWPAESYHQDYYQQNRAAGYCQVVIAPKLDKLGLDK
jgi:peptide-methionine (S)-S-oxide reductase